MAKTTLHSSNAEVDVVTIKNEQHLQITLTGITNKNYIGPGTTYASPNKVVIYFPLWFLPSFMSLNRKALGKWRKNQTDFIARLEAAFETPIPEVKD